MWWHCAREFLQLRFTLSSRFVFYSCNATLKLFTAPTTLGFEWCTTLCVCFILGARTESADTPAATAAINLLMKHSPSCMPRVEMRFFKRMEKSLRHKSWHTVYNVYFLAEATGAVACICPKFEPCHCTRTRQTQRVPKCFKSQITRVTISNFCFINTMQFISPPKINNIQIIYADCYIINYMSHKKIKYDKEYYANIFFCFEGDNFLLRTQISFLNCFLWIQGWQRFFNWLFIQ